MQVVISAICKKGVSLREAIAKDDRWLGKNSLEVVREKQPGRSPGWLKLRSMTSQHGAINIAWDGQSNVLTARVVTRGSQRPSVVVGEFVHYVLSRFRRRVLTLTIHTVG
jgi:hypothetical protein